MSESEEVACGVHGSTPVTFACRHLAAEQRTLTFSDRGEPRVVADVRLVGSYSTKSNSFQWSWGARDENGESEIDDILHLPAFGEVRGIERLFAAYVLGCEGVYRAPFDHLYWFMLLSGFRAPN